MSGTMNLQDALDILKRRYEREYCGFDNIYIDIKTEKCTGVSRDWGGFEDYYTYYAIYADISFEKRIGTITIKNQIRKTSEDLKDDLKEELSELFKDEEYSVFSIYLPSFKDYTINYDREVEIFFENKKEKSLNKKIN